MNLIFLLISDAEIAAYDIICSCKFDVGVYIKIQKNIGVADQKCSKL